MGALTRDDDYFVGSFLETLNLCFGSYPDALPTADDARLTASEAAMKLGTNGIREIQAIQAEFNIFDVDRPLVQSLRALGVGGAWNPHAKRKWYMALRRLDHYPSNVAGLTGGKAIAKTLADHLASDNPRPVHFKAHDTRAEGAQVLITQRARPVFYLEEDYLVISIPMTPRSASPGIGGATAATRPIRRPASAEPASRRHAARRSTATKSK